MTTQHQKEARRDVLENARWICDDWAMAHRFDTPDLWAEVTMYLYGATQASIMSDGHEDYDDYKMLLRIARAHRSAAADKKYGVAA
jgi:hypothetical protein